MKNYLLFFCCVLLMLTSSAGAQGPSAATSDSYRFGSRIVRIPAPAGFTDVVPRFDRLTGRFTASESPDNEVVAVHVPDAIVPRLQKGEEPDLDFYTKVSVGKRVKTVDVTAEDFGLVIAGFEKEFDTLLDPKGPVLTGVVKNKNMQKGLTEHWGQGSPRRSERAKKPWIFR